MIILDFKTNEQSLQEDVAIGLGDKSALLVTYLELPVRFSVDDVDLLETLLPQASIFQVDPSGNVEIVAINQEQHLFTPWAELPLLDFAITCYRKVREACKGTNSIYEIPNGGYLHFEVLGDKVSIYSTVNKKTVETDCSRLIEAFTTFSARARALAEHLFPELKMDITWNDWLA
jgi:hypothetical protein